MGLLVTGACFWFMACTGAPERPGPGNAPTVTTGSGSALGTRALTVNGSIHPHGEPTTYYFEYGPSKDYGSIDQVQGHLNDDFFHLAAFIDVDNPPSGSIDFDEFQLVYRNESLLFPDNGGRLVSWPQDSPDDPATLTDGWRHGSGRMWKSSPDPEAPQEFVYTFQRPVTIDAIQLHQNPEWPGKEVEILASEDGETYTTILSRSLPRKGDPNANFAFTLDQGLATRSGHLKVRLLSGYEARHWGLGEIEVFGSGAVMRPDDDLYNVNTDIGRLTPGTTYHYRLVGENRQGVSYGDDATFTTAPAR